MQDRVGAADSSSSDVVTINKRLDALSSPPTHTIFKIHTLLRRESAMAYEPEILAIGPYHHGKERLQAMEVWKLHGLKSILDLRQERDATKCVEFMKGLEAKARKCYSESVISSADEFAEMLLLDGCFIIQFFLLIIERLPMPPNTLMINHSFFEVDWVKDSLCRDVLLLENQIPFFVLEKLFSFLTNESTHFFLQIAQEFVSIAFYRITVITIPAETSLSNGNDVEHLLGLLHRIFCPPVSNHEAQDPPPSTSVDDNGKGIKSSFKLLAEKLRSLSCGMLDCDEGDMEGDSEIIPSATKLQDSGVTLKKKEVEKGNPFDVTFVNGVMEVPIIYVCDNTETCYRNLIAYGQYCQKNPNRCFARHAIFMDCLIDSPEDVALLRRCGIICNLLGDDEAVATMFNKLGKHINISLTGHYRQIAKEVNEHCSKRRHKWMAKLKHDYFNNPWSFISVLAAVFLLLLTVAQTVFSAMGS